MIKFFDGNLTQADSENVFNNVNRYILLNSSNGVLDDIAVLKDLLDEQINDLNRYVNSMDYLYNIDPILSIDASNKMKSFIKKIIRKVIQWCFCDMVAKQTEFNTHVDQYVNSEVMTLTTISGELSFLMKKLLENENKINKLVEDNVKNEK